MKFASKLMWGAGIIVLAIVVWALVSQSSSSKYDSFAQCITSKGMKMYGAFWCPHCQDQKKMFGNSIKYVNYIECSTSDGQGQIPECTLAGIQSYPTWELPGGAKKQGSLTLQELSVFTGCQLPA